MYCIALVGVLVLIGLFYVLSSNQKPNSEPMLIQEQVSVSMTIEDSAIVEFEVPIDTILHHEVRATFYNPVPSQTDSSPDKTATGFMIDLNDPYKHKIIAISRDLEQLGYAMGDSVHLHFPNESKSSIYDGVYVIQDRMNKKHTMKIDLLVAPDMYMSYIKGVEITKLQSVNLF